ncbi:MAG: hypothetical protein ABSE57_18735 [Bryobacteraceae bacterium]
MIQKLLDDGLEVPLDAPASLALALASGVADSLSGRLFSVSEDVAEIVRQSEQVLDKELYLLRVRPLEGSAFNRNLREAEVAR